MSAWNRPLRRLACAIAGLGLLAGCAGRPFNLPADPGAPLPDPGRIHAALIASCSGVRTITAELGLSGRAGGERVRGRAVAGFEAPASMRLEGLAPFGPPAFILATPGGEATLLLPRESSVLRGAPAQDILGALTGVALAPADLMAILTGCGSPSRRAVSGFQHRGGWTSIELDDGTRLYAGGAENVLRLRIVRRGEWEIHYREWQGRFPSEVRLISSAAGVDVRVGVSQLEANVPLDPAAFRVDVPADAAPISLEDLREAGPLRGRAATR